MATENRVRIENLKRLVNEHDGMTALGKKLGYTGPAFVSNILKGHKTMGEKMARKWEEKLGKPEGWMDRMEGAIGGAAIDVALLTQVLNMAGEELRAAKLTLPNEKFAQLVAHLYSDAHAAGGLQAEKVRSLVSLVAR